MIITKEMVNGFESYLVNEEKSRATTEKYLRDVNNFFKWAGGANIEKSIVLSYKEELLMKYAPRSVNAALSSLNSFFKYAAAPECVVKTLKIQQRIFADKEKELTKSEYERLLKTALDKRNKKLWLLMQTICASGIRVSELKFITVAAVRLRQANINCKGKLRTVILPLQLCHMLEKYIKEQNISSGSVFISKNGKPLDRSNIWTAMKKLCKSALVASNKVFPHNLRHLFARTYYSAERDIVRLADILGHSSINTTRIYTMESGEVHRRRLQRLNLLCNQNTVTT